MEATHGVRRLTRAICSPDGGPWGKLESVNGDRGGLDCEAPGDACGGCAGD